MKHSALPHLLYRLVAAALIIVSVIIPGQTSHAAVPAAPFSATTLTVAYPGAPITLEPSTAYDNQGAAILRGVYEGLVHLKGTSVKTVEGVLATHWTTNPQRTIWTFYLRHNVYFHDGTPFNAAAVKFNIARTIAINQAPAYIFGQYMSAKDVQIIDPYTVRFHLRVPAPRLLYALSSQWGVWMVSPSAVKAHSVKGDMAQQWLTMHDAGTGPYTMSQFIPNQQVTLTAFPHYWRGWTGHHVTRILISFVTQDATRRELIEKGDADLSNLFTPEDLASMAKNPALVVDSGSIVANWTLVPTLRPPFNSVAARLGLAYAFDYAGFVQKLMKGFARPARGPLNHYVDGYNPSTTIFDTNLAKAKQLFAAAGITPGTTLTMWYINEDETTRDVALVTQAQLAQLGIIVKLEGHPAAAYTNVYYGNAPATQRPNLWVGGWSGDYNDALAWLLPQYHSKDPAGDGGANAGMYHDATVDKLLEEAAVTVNPSTRQGLLDRLQTILTVSDPAAVYVGEEANSTTYRRWLHGYYYNTAYPFTFDYYSMWK